MSVLEQQDYPDKPWDSKPRVEEENVPAYPDRRHSLVKIAELVTEGTD